MPCRSLVGASGRCGRPAPRSKRLGPFLSAGARCYARPRCALLGRGFRTPPDSSGAGMRRSFRSLAFWLTIVVITIAAAFAAAESPSVTSLLPRHLASCVRAVPPSLWLWGPSCPHGRLARPSPSTGFLSARRYGGSRCARRIGWVVFFACRGLLRRLRKIKSYVTPFILSIFRSRRQIGDAYLSRLRRMVRARRRRRLSLRSALR